MREARSTEGPYPVRLFYDVREIDDICLQSLREEKCLPQEPEAIEIDFFLEQYFKIQVIYEDLDPGIMGSTVFDSMGRVTGIMVARWLEEEDGETGERRARSTLAHEGGHALLHSRLFMKDTSPTLFQENTSAPPGFMCRTTDIGAVGSKPKYDGRWWEWQANRAIGGLLLPIPLVTSAVSSLVGQGTFGPELPEANRREAELHVAKTFDVNPVVARIRLEELFPRDRVEVL